MIPRHPWGGLADPALKPPADLLILGLPWEGGACWRGGASEAPRRLRAISSTSPAISETGTIVTPDLLRVVDLGDVQPEPGGGTDGEARAGAAGGGAIDDGARRAYFDRVQRTVTEQLGRPGTGGGPPFLLTIGGDHSAGIPLLRGFSASKPAGYGLISLDAHPDLFDTYEGSPLSSACPMRRALDSTNLDPAHLLILGTRSYNAVELEFMRTHGIRFVPARDLDAMGMEAAVVLARERMAGVRDVYLTIDIDVADPGCAPGTGAPVAGGLSGRQLLNLVRGLLERLPVRALDILEVAPPLDPTEATLFLALQICFETFAVVAGRRPGMGDRRPGV
jgi:arginase family enzyme